MVRSAARAASRSEVSSFSASRQQCLLRVGVRAELGVALGRNGVAGCEEGVLGGLEPLPQCVVDVLARAARGLPLGQQVAEGRRGGPPVGGIGQFLGAFAQRLLGLTGPRPFAVQLGEMRAAPAVEGFPGRRITLPQRVVGLAVKAADRAPLLENLPQPVPGGLPLRGVRGQLLGLGGQGFLAGGLGDAVFLPLGLVGRSGGVGVLADRRQPAPPARRRRRAPPRVGRLSASAAAAALILRASPVPETSRLSISATSVLRSSKRRPKWA